MSFLGCIVLFISNSLCSSAGVGGGTLNVPILIKLFGFDYATAVVLSLSALMGNYLMQFLVNLDKRHPSSPSKPLIYWHAVLVLFPAELGGSNLGIILSAVIPNTILYVLAVLVLSFAGWITLKKGLHLYECESIAIAERESVAPLMGSEESEFLLRNKSYNTGGSDTISNSNSIKTEQHQQHRWDEFSHHNSIFDFEVQQPKPVRKETIRSIIPPYLYCYLCDCRDREQRLQNYSFNDNGDEYDLNIDLAAALPVSLPWVAIRVVLGVWLLYAVCYVVMTEFSACSGGYYAVLGVIYPLLVVEIWWGLRHVEEVQREQPDNVAQGDIDWSRTSYAMPAVAFAVGALTTLLGIGGGELMGPLLLMAKVLPVVSSATTSFMSLLNSSSSLLHYLVLNELPLAHAALTFLVGAAGGLTGRVGGLYVAQKYRRPSALVFALVAVLAVSFSVYATYIVSEPPNLHFGSLCAKDALLQSTSQ